MLNHEVINATLSHFSSKYMSAFFFLHFDLCICLSFADWMCLISSDSSRLTKECHVFAAVEAAWLPEHHGFSLTLFLFPSGLLTGNEYEKEAKRSLVTNFLSTHRLCK